MQMRSKKDLRRLNEFMELPGHPKWLRYNMREIMRATLHEDSEKGHPSHKAWLYGELFTQLWTWLRKLAASAENPNVRSDAGRVLGKVIHEIGTTQGALWIEELSKTNEEFQDSLVPFPSRKGGKPPKEDLVRWVGGQMIRLEWHWTEAMEVAWLVKSGRYSTLKEGWSALSEQKGRSRPAWKREIEGHPFTLLEFHQLEKFSSLWSAALEEIFRSAWQDQKTNGSLPVKGERNFIKRFGTVKNKEAGLHLAERHFHQRWTRRWRDIQANQRRFEEVFARELGGA